MEKFPRLKRLLTGTACLLLLSGCAQTAMLAKDVFKPAPKMRKSQSYSQSTPSAPPSSAPVDSVSLAQAKQYFADQNYELAFQSLLPLANSGDPDAQYGVGYLFYYGKGIPADRDSGISWIRKSARQGFPNAIKALQLLNVSSQYSELDELDNADEASIAAAENLHQANKTRVSHADYDMKQLLANEAAVNNATTGNATAQRFTPANSAKATRTASASTYHASPNFRVAETDTALLDASTNHPAEQTADAFEHTSNKQTAQAVTTLQQAIASRPQHGGTTATYGPTRTDDTLWSIAKKVRPDDNITVQQMMMALLRHNPHAFASANVNTLKKGMMLTVPDTQAILQQDPQQSLAESQYHQATWQR